MKFPRSLTLLLLCGMSAAAQMPTTSPIRLGLWQSEGVSKVTMPGLPESTEPQKVRTCVGPDTWKDFLGTSSEQMKRCEKKNVTYANRTLSMDIVCAGDGASGSMNGHLSLVFDSQESAHADARLTLNSNGSAMQVTSTLTARFLQDSCGELKPGQQKDLK